MDNFLLDVEWKSTGLKPDGGRLPFATHEGIFHFCGVDLKCYQLSDGRAIIDAEDLHRLIDAAGLADTAEVSKKFRGPPPPPASTLEE